MRVETELLNQIKLLQELIAYFEAGYRMIPPEHSDEYVEALASVSDRRIEQMDSEARR